MPSKASIVRLVTASATSSETPIVGGSGGAPFELSCNASEALVGVYGLADTTSVKRIGLRCVPVDSAGRWVGNPVDRSAVGGSAGATYRRLCPRDHAISGFNARVSSAINALRFECRALSPSGQLSGSGQLLSWIGATQGSATGKMRCPSNYPVYALAGRASGQLDALGAQCRRVP